MSDSPSGKISNVLNETRIFPPSPSFSQQASIGSMAQYQAIYDTSITELGSALSPDLREELGRLAFPFQEDGVPTEIELRVAQAQLVGWLEGLFHGIQTALFAQQMSARAQFEEMRRRAIPAGPGDEVGPEHPGGTGNYL
jgi:hypothetical protein